MSQFVKLLDPHHSEDSVNMKFKMSITPPHNCLWQRSWCSIHWSHFPGTNCALYLLQGEMTLPWMPPLFKRTTSLKFASQGVTPIHWMCSVIPLWISSSVSFNGWFIACYSRNSKNNRLWVKPSLSGYGSFRGPCHSVPGNVAFESLKWGERAAYTSLTNLPKWGKHHIISKQNLETLLTMSCISSWRT